jgi:hypothetical protein
MELEICFGCSSAFCCPVWTFTLAGTIERIALTSASGETPGRAATEI